MDVADAGFPVARTRSLPPSVTIAEGQTTGQFFAAAEVAATGIQVQAQWNGTNATTNVAIGGSVCGDIDGSGALSLPDAVRLLRSIAGLDAAPNC